MDGAGGEAGWDHEINRGSEGGEVVVGEPDGGGKEVLRERKGVKEAGDGLGGEFDVGDTAEDDAGDGALAEGDEDDMPGQKRDIGAVSKRSASVAIGLGWYYLEKHGFIIAQLGIRGGF